jgi:lipoyl(octanoyl) transferase
MTGGPLTGEILTGGPLTGRTKTPPVFRRFDGLQPYEPIVTAMADHVAAIRQDGADEEVWLLEHAPVLTGGTSAQDSDLVDTSNIAVHRSGRGGQWTFHGPGQRVAYVMLDLGARAPDVRAYVHALESWIIDVLDGFGIAGQRRPGHPGIWVNGNGQLDKIAAIGVRISRWVSWHGIAINLDPDLSAFDRIIPCGVRDGGVTSMAAQGVACDMAALDAALQTCFASRFAASADQVRSSR